MDQIIIFLTLGIALILFIWEKVRYDIVSLLALFTLIVTGLVPAQDAFTGFGHPAVVTVAAVLIISQAFQNSGLVDMLSALLYKTGKNLAVHIFILSFLVAFASAFINNIGALAILMPVAIHLARRSGHSPSFILMPLAFASILGGMITLIGTPPNIIIATFRADVAGVPFSMFDFTPAGLAVALSGLLFTTLLGWKILPKRQTQDYGKDLFHIENYITEVVITEDSKLRGKTIGNVNNIADTEVLILSIIRNKVRIYAPLPSEELKADDILILEADTNDLETFISNTGVQIAGQKQFREKLKVPGDIETLEAVVMADSPLIGQSAKSINLRRNYDINLLAIARSEKLFIQRIWKTPLKSGDVLLLQGRSAYISEAIKNMRFLPLAKRELSIDKPKKDFFTLIVFALAITAVVLNILPVQIAFSIAAVTLVITNVLPLKDMYTSIDWPIIVLLGAMIPVAEAFETSGSANLVTGLILDFGKTYPIWIILGMMMVITILLSNVVNNAAAAVLMAPIAISISEELAVSPDPFLIATAIAASCAVLTPIGHQSNALVMGQGGYKFGDYWKMGLPVTLITLIVGIPVILYFWPA